MAHLACANLLNRKLLTTLAVLIIAFGVALVLVLTGITTGTLEENVQRMMRANADMIVHPKSFNIIFDNVARLPSAYRGKLEEVEGVEYAIPVLLERVVLANQSHNLYAVESADFRRLMPDAELLEGEWLSGGHELLIDTRLASVAGLHAGDTVNVLDTPFRVAGICRTVMPVRLFAPRETMGEVAGRPNNVTFFFVKCKDPGAVGPVGEAIEARFTALETLYLATYRDVLYRSFKLMQETIGAINVSAAFMSFLVVLLSMFMSILTRTRDIGILKSLGASRRFIVRSIVTEALMIACMGVAAGIGLAFLLKPVIMHVKPLTTLVIHARWLGVAMVLGIGGGLLGALGPALYASRLDPVETLSYE